MNVNANHGVATPSFQAKLKNNTITEKVVNKMNNTQLAEFKDALNNLSKVSPNDVVEVTNKKTSSSRGFGPYDMNNYSVKNTKDEGSSYNFKSTPEKLAPEDLIDIVKKLANPKTKVSKAVLPNNEGVHTQTKAEARQEVFDMMA